jgi:hypothetical protein
MRSEATSEAATESLFDAEEGDEAAKKYVNKPFVL